MDEKCQPNSEAILRVFKNCQLMSFTTVLEFYDVGSSQMYMIRSLHEINQHLQAQLEKVNRAYNVQPGQSYEES